MCVAPELRSRGGYLFLLTSSVCIITRLPGPGSRCYESARVTNDHGNTHTHTCIHTHNTRTDSERLLLESPEGKRGVCVYLLSGGLALGVWPGFGWGGTDCIHSPDNRPAMRRQGGETLGPEQGRVRQVNPKKNTLPGLCARRCAANWITHMTQYC